MQSVVQSVKSIAVGLSDITAEVAELKSIGVPANDRFVSVMEVCLISNDE